MSGGFNQALMAGLALYVVAVLVQLSAQGETEAEAIS